MWRKTVKELQDLHAAPADKAVAKTPASTRDVIAATVLTLVHVLDLRSALSLEPRPCKKTDRQTACGLSGVSCTFTPVTVYTVSNGLYRLGQAE